MSNPQKTYIGLMSGTSLDGIDAALVSFDAQGPHLHKFITYPLPDTLKQQLIDLNHTPQIHLAQLCQLEVAMAEIFIAATRSLLKQSQRTATDIAAIGSHGQTIFHTPNHGMTLQIGHPAYIAKKTGIQTVADFRVDDMANGGQGAPLAPAFHAYLLAHQAPVALVNIGGIANISLIGQQVIGFDTGPGNALMDEICQRHFNCRYDAQGALAASAKVAPELLSQLQAHPYFKLTAPKSTGRETFNLTWLEPILAKHPSLSPAEILSTLNQLTVNTIAESLSNLAEAPKALLICGGGAYNDTLLERLQAKLSIPVTTTESYHIHPAALEAMMCAWLAKERLAANPISLQSITGASQDSILGGIWHP